MLLRRMKAPKLRLQKSEFNFPSTYVCPRCSHALSTSAPRTNTGSSPFRARLRASLRHAKVQWRPIPVGLGIASVGALQFYRVQKRNDGQEEGEDGEEQSRAEEKQRLPDQENEEGTGSEPRSRPRRRARIIPDGPWYDPGLIVVSYD